MSVVLPFRRRATLAPPRVIELRYGWQVVLTDAGARGSNGAPLVFGQLLDPTGNIVASVLPSRPAAAESALRVEHGGRTGLFGRRSRH